MLDFPSFLCYTGRKKQGAINAMHIDEKEALRRLASSSNLVNSLGKKSASASSPSLSDKHGVSPSQFNREEVVPSIDADKVSLLPRGRGGRGNSPNIPAEMRDEIQTLALSGRHTQADIAGKFGVSRQAVSECARGTLGGRPATAEAIAIREDKVASVRDVALDKLMASLGLLLPEDLTKLKPTELSRVAKDMAAVHRSLEAGQATDPNKGVTLNVYVPAPRELQNYKVIEV